MPTNEERREIANELRYTSSHSLNGYSFQRSVEGTVFGTIGDRPWRETLTRLADLIEPEERTCRMKYNKIKRGVYCSHCGERMDVYTWEHHVDGTAGYLYPFCYWCGAKVVEE